MKVGIINTKYGSLYAIYKSIINLGHKAEIFDNPNEFKKFDKLIIPGTGNSLSIMNYLKSNYLSDGITNFKNSGKYILGICIGMQILACKSEEGGGVNCLNYLDSNVLSLSKSFDIKTNIGWSKIKFNKEKNEFESSIKDNSYFFFCHSYYLKINSGEKKILISSYDSNSEIPAIIKKDNLIGVQFHPEKSQINGRKFLEHFLKL